jgi:hypothetical protein
MPDDVHAEVARLGAPVAEFRTGGPDTLRRRLVSILMILFGLAMLLLGGIGFAALFSRWGWRAVLSDVFKLALMGLLGVILGIAVLFRGRATRGLRVLVFADGLARLQGSLVEVVRWDEVNEVRRIPNAGADGVHTKVTWLVQLVLVCGDGREVVFNEALSGLRRLRLLVEENTLRFMLPAGLEAFEAGKAIGFGMIAVSPDGIHHGSNTLPWERLEEAKVEDGDFVVRETGAQRPFCKMPVGLVPNSHVLLALIGRADRAPEG